MMNIERPVYVQREVQTDRKGRKGRKKNCGPTGTPPNRPAIEPKKG